MAVTAATLIIPASSSGVVGSLIQVTTAANVCVQVPDNDILVAHTGMNGTATSTANDYVLIGGVSLGTNMPTALSTNATSAVYVPSGGSATLRGFDVPYDEAETTGISYRKFLLRAVGNPCTVQIIKGSNPVTER